MVRCDLGTIRYKNKSKLLNKNYRNAVVYTAYRSEQGNKLRVIQEKSIGIQQRNYSRNTINVSITRKKAEWVQLSLSFSQKKCFCYNFTLLLYYKYIENEHQKIVIYL